MKHTFAVEIFNCPYLVLNAVLVVAGGNSEKKF